MSLSTDRNDPGLNKIQENGQQETYLVLSEEEITQGFVRPVRTSYVHVGIDIDMSKVEPISEEDEENAVKFGWVGFIRNEDPERPELVGRFVTIDDIISGCNKVTTMARPIAETYARDPNFYGSTYCVGCKKHLPVKEFVWEGTNEKLGS